MNPVHRFRSAIVLAVALACSVASAAPPKASPQQSAQQADDNRYAAFLQHEAKIGPAHVALRDEAVIDLPEGYAFLPEKPAADFMKRIGNTTSDNFRGIVLPQKQSNWFIFVEYNGSGYIKDDDAKNWNIDTMLDDIRRSTAEGNEERKIRGAPELEILGWVEKPHYEAATHRLIWSVSAREKDAKNASNNIINYRTLVLGRQGYTAMIMVTDLSTIEAQKPIAKLLLSRLSFNNGKRYTDFNASTDHVAEYGLVALIGGVVAHKLGFFALMAAFAAKFVKGIALAVVAGLATVRRFFFRSKPAAPAAPQLPPSGPETK
jgi:uncharacterized membrane-anchored protein